MFQQSVKLVTMQGPRGMVLGISLKIADIPLGAALKAGFHIEPLRDGNYIDIQDAIRWYQAAKNQSAVDGLIAAARLGRSILNEKAS